MCAGPRTRRASWPDGCGRRSAPRSTFTARGARTASSASRCARAGKQYLVARTGRGRLGSASVPGLLDYAVVLAPPARPCAPGRRAEPPELRRPALRAGGRSCLSRRALDGIEGLPVTPQGEALYEDLLWVHGLLRQDLATVERLAVEVVRRRDCETWSPRSGARDHRAALAAARELPALLPVRAPPSPARGPGALPRASPVNPSLGPVVDRLQEDHRRVAGLLEGVESAVDDLDRDDTPAARASVATALEALAAHLLAHLELEEESVAETLRRWEPSPRAAELRDRV